LTPDLPSAVGGVKIHYQVVDALNAAGVPAAVVHLTPGFRCSWFNNATRIEYVDSLKLAANDVVVVPEEWIQYIPLLPPETVKVVFNQNAYSVFSWGVEAAKIKEIYHRRDVRRVVAVSEDNKAYLEYALPGVDVVRMRFAIDSSMFHAGEPKGRTLSYMPRKRTQETIDVLSLLQLRGALDGWEVIRIDGFDEAATAAALRRSAVFLSFSQREGLGLPPGEAMACGCLVIGFHGYGGRDLGDNAIWVTDGDVMGFAAKVEEVLASWDRDRHRFEGIAQRASSYIAQTYSTGNRDKDVLAAFGTIDAGNSSETVGTVSPAFWDVSPRWQRAAGRIQRAVRTLVPEVDRLSEIVRAHAEGVKRVFESPSPGANEYQPASSEASASLPKRSNLYWRFYWFHEYARFLSKMGVEQPIEFIKRFPSWNLYSFLPGLTRRPPPPPVLQCAAVEEAVRLFYRDGFVVLSDALTTEEAANLKSVVKREADEIVRMDEEGSLPPGLKHGDKRYSFGEYGHRHEWEYLARNEKILAILKGIWKGQAFRAVVAGGDFVLPGGTYQHLHNDMAWTAAGEKIPRVITVNYYVSDVLPTSGPLRQVPGTAGFPVPNKFVKRFEPEWMKHSVTTGKPGYAIVRDPRVWHGGTPNTSSEPRYMPNLEFALRDVPAEEIAGTPVLNQLKSGKWITEFENA
jgi:ectoine hydroxylase-related dioxygenase (phytanoyl-CoA dioxygenase family)